MSQNVFISYSRADTQQARDIHDRLEAEQVNVWWDQENNRGEDYSRQLTFWIRSAHSVILLLSQRSVGSTWVKREVLWADAYKRRILPVYLDSKQTLLEVEENSILLLVIDLDRINAYEGHDPVPEILYAIRQAAPDTLRLQPDHSDTTMPERKPPVLSERIKRKLMTGQGHTEPLLPPAAGDQRVHQIITLRGTLDEFTPEVQAAFIDIITMLAELIHNEVVIVKVREGSILVTLELPETTARWLLQLYKQQAPLIGFLGATAVGEPEPLPPPAPEPTLLARLRVWLGALSMPQRLVGVGGVALLLFVLVLWPFLNPSRQLTDVALCDDLTLTSQRCASGMPTPFFNGDRVSGTLSSAEETVPRVIVPRSTHLLTLTPTVRWTPVRGTKSYSVTLRQGITRLWSTVVTGTTELAYPPVGAPALEPGQSYRFDVTTATSGPESAQAIGFNVVTAEEAAAIDAEVQVLRAQRRDTETTAVLLANLYAQHRLYAEALEILTPLAATTTRPAVELLLGNLYVSIGLFDLAQAPYERALTLAEVTNDQLTEALAHTRLGEIATLQGDRNGARAHYEQAIQNFKHLGFDTYAAELTERLQGLPR